MHEGNRQPKDRVAIVMIGLSRADGRGSTRNCTPGENTGGVVGVVQSEESFRDASALRYWSREETNRGGNV